MANESAFLDLSLGVHIADVNVYNLYQSILANPAAFGYTNVATPAQGLNVNPDQYLFWDLPSHPTTTGHRLIALSAETAVVNTFAPEPATWAFTAGGLLLLAWGVARRVTKACAGRLHTSRSPGSTSRPKMRYVRCDCEPICLVESCLAVDQSRKPIGDSLEFGVDSARQIIAEIGPAARVFASAAPVPGFQCPVRGARERRGNTAFSLCIRQGSARNFAID
jgi:hypothetical protein